jgi:hypothetical protein
MQMKSMGHSSIKEVLPDLAEGSQHWLHQLGFHSVGAKYVWETCARRAARVGTVAAKSVLIFVMLLTNILGSGHAQLRADPLSQETAAAAQGQETAEQLQQLVAPIALYPDALVAQILHPPIQRKSFRRIGGCSRIPTCKRASWRLRSIKSCGIQA